MKVVTIRYCMRGQGCDTVAIRDYDGREVVFHRAHLPLLIKMLKTESKRTQGVLV